jgi:hypothetical protein
VNLDAFTPDEQNALRECVAALRALPIYASPDFEAVFGSSKREVEEVYAAFPEWDFYDESAIGHDASGDVVRNALAWLLNGSKEDKKLMHATLSFGADLLPQLHKKFES